MLISLAYGFGLFVIYTFCTFVSAFRLKRMESHSNWLMFFFMFGPHVDALFMVRVEKKRILGWGYFILLSFLIAGIIYLLIDVVNKTY